jgi:hypothetical protein
MHMIMATARTTRTTKKQPIKQGVFSRFNRYVVTLGLAATITIVSLFFAIDQTLAVHSLSSALQLESQTLTSIGITEQLLAETRTTQCERSPWIATSNCYLVMVRAYKAPADIKAAKAAITTQFKSNGWPAPISNNPGQYFYDSPSAYAITSQATVYRNTNSASQFLDFYISRDLPHPDGKEFHGTGFVCTEAVCQHIKTSGATGLLIMRLATEYETGF